MKRMLINATQQEELRVALVDGQFLYDFDVEKPGQQQKKANIYVGEITRVEQSLEAAFVNFGSNRQGFLPWKEISPDYHQTTTEAGSSGEQRQSNIKDLIKVGQKILVQVDKDERGTKGAALTTYISLAGSFLVLMPNNPRAGGISRRIDGDDRSELRAALSELAIPEDMGVIVRTAGVGRSVEELQWDLAVLLKHWSAIKQVYQDKQAPLLIYQESDITIRAVRDHLRRDTSEILIDDESIYQRLLKHIEIVRPDYAKRVKLYKDSVPLFNRFQIERQIETAYQREVRLSSGGAIVIDHTEALTSIDINSAKATRGGDIEETALHTNLEAADEIARQLRLRDLGGLVVIDFIDMGQNRNQREVENRLRDALQYDRARVQVSRISRFGLLEMSRQRLRSSLGESSQVICPRCSGQGTIRNIESLALSVLRLIEEDAMKEKTGQIQAQLPVEVATFLLNEKRGVLTSIEQDYQVEVLLIPNQFLETPHYYLKRMRTDEVASASSKPASYALATLSSEEIVEEASKDTYLSFEQPAIQSVHLTPGSKAPQQKQLLLRLYEWLVSKFQKPTKKPQQRSQRRRSGQRNQQRKPQQQRQGQRRSQQHNNQHKSRNNQGRSSQGQQQADLNVNKLERAIESLQQGDVVQDLEAKSTAANEHTAKSRDNNSNNNRRKRSRRKNRNNNGHRDQNCEHQAGDRGAQKQANQQQRESNNQTTTGSTVTSVAVNEDRES